jgi:hypothetical protein
MPTPPGFSGGPVLALRPVRSAFVALPRDIRDDVVAVGVLSHEIEGQSYAIRALRLFTHVVPAPDGTTLLDFPPAVERGWIGTAGARAQRVFVDKDPSNPGNTRVRIR